MAKTEYRSAIRSRRLIQEALADLLQEKPLDRITVTDLVKRADINRGTFYAHYTSIPDVIDHLIRQTFSELHGTTADPDLPPHQVAEKMLLRLQELLEEDLEFYRKVLSSGAAALMQEQLVQALLECISKREDWQRHFDSFQQYILTLRFCAGGLSQLYRDWFAGLLDLTLDELTANACALIQAVTRHDGPCGNLSEADIGRFSGHS